MTERNQDKDQLKKYKPKRAKGTPSQSYTYRYDSLTPNQETFLLVSSNMTAGER